MASKPGVLALVVAITALGVATYGVSTRASGPTNVDARLVALEDEVMSLRRATARSRDEAPRLRGIDPTRLPSAKAAHEEATPVALVSREDGVIDAIVAEAVEKKTQEVVDEMRVKENKKPAMIVLASTLELSPAQVAAVKRNLRATFKRDWSAEQYTEFEAWGVDPTEIQDVPGSPNAALEERIGERARDFGAELPEGK